MYTEDQLSKVFNHSLHEFIKVAEREKSHFNNAQYLKLLDEWLEKAKNKLVQESKPVIGKSVGQCR